MQKNNDPHWLDWAKRLQAIAQIGMEYSDNPYDLDRYEAIRRVAAEIMSHHTNMDTTSIVNVFEREKGYATPKIDLRGAVFKDNSVLLTMEKMDHNRWTLPGGWADVSESPAEGVMREVWEETGYRVGVDRLLAVYDRSLHEHHPPFPFHIYKMFFLCHIQGGEARETMESAGTEFFPIDNLPELSVSRITERQLKRLYHLYRHPEEQTDFDALSAKPGVGSD